MHKAQQNATAGFLGAGKVIVAQAVEQGGRVPKWLTSSAAALGCLILCSCASPKPASYTFVAPSVAPVKQAVTRVEQHVKGATDAAAKLEAACKVKDEGWANAYQSLRDELTQAQVGLASAQDLADTLQHEADKLAEQGGKVARERDDALEAKAKAQAVATKRLKRCWLLTGLATALGLWIFRKPLLMAAGL